MANDELMEYGLPMRVRCIVGREWAAMAHSVLKNGDHDGRYCGSIRRTCWTGSSHTMFVEQNISCKHPQPDGEQHEPIANCREQDI